MSDKTLQEEMEDLRKAWLDLMYEISKPVIRFAKRLNLELKPWVREREIREKWTAPTDGLYEVKLRRKPPGDDT